MTDPSSVDGRTIGQIISTLFPTGTITARANSHAISADAAIWPECPRHPADLFAAAAVLLERAAAYPFIEYRGEGTEEPSRNGEWPHPVIVADDLRHERLREIARRWVYTSWEEFNPSEDVLARPPLAEICALWARIGAAVSSRIYDPGTFSATNPQDWWEAAYDLLVIADEAADGLGFDFIDTGNNRKTLRHSAVANYHTAKPGEPDSHYNRFVLAAQLAKMPPPDSSDILLTHFETSSTLAPCADADVFCVQPKMHTAAVGSALRSLSHNLALLPPRGIVRGIWHRPYGPLPKELETSLNLLMVPFPFRLQSRWFKPSGGQKGSTEKRGWGWVDISNAHWLYGEENPTQANKEKRRQQLWDLLENLIEEAQHDVRDLHGIVFPEDALDWDTFEFLAKKLFDPSQTEKFGKLSFLIAGSSEDCKKQPGTCVITAARSNVLDAKDRAIATSRRKHHRWRLDRGQIITYGLSAALEPSYTYWENIGLPNREVHVHVFRNSSTLTAMLCEDLARVDPCHTILRSIGPNLVLVLLMDGPQIDRRWPARYATVLAEDPGSSVLTLTSLGLIRRSNEAGLFRDSRSIGLFRDNKSDPREITCPVGHHAAVVMLHGVPSIEYTLDGRRNQDAIAYRYAGQRAIKCKHKALFDPFDGEG